VADECALILPAKTEAAVPDETLAHGSPLCQGRPEWHGFVRCIGAIGRPDRAGEMDYAAEVSR